MDNDQKHTAKATERFLKVNKLDIFNGQASHDRKAKEHFLITDDKTEGRKIHKQAVTEGEALKR